MRRAAIVIITLIVLWNCAGEGVTIYAPPQLAGAAILIDGRAAGHFLTTQRGYRWVGWKKIKEELSAPPRSETIAKLPPVAPGPHELRIVKTGYEPILTTFNYSAARVELEIHDEQVKSMIQ